VGHVTEIRFDIRAMHPSDRDAVRTLILDGLREHWGTIDPTLNRDLDDLGATEHDRVTLVATDGGQGGGQDGGRVVGTGTVVRRDDRCAEIIRMSVAKRDRCEGVGRLLVEALIAGIRQWSVERVVLETTASWTDVMHFYERSGFTVTHFADGDFGRDAWFELELPDQLTD